METILIRKLPGVANPTAVDLPASKSESNRALVIDALCGGGSELFNLSEARDTQIMHKLLMDDSQEVNARDAGTTMRFLTAYFAITSQKRIITGTERMKERPIGILVDALRFIGAEIVYKEKDGFPPVETRGFSKQENSNITIRGDISSQYISALLMVAPHLPQGLRIQISGEIGSKPYIEMTLALMRQFGAKFEWQDDRTILVQPMPYRRSTFSIESDWSAASYWFAITALADPCEVSLKGLKPNSLQGDSRIVDMMDPLGVNADFDDRGLLLTKKEHKDNVEFDFTASPDLAQTVAVTCALKGIKCRMTGLHSLRIKETDRIAALQTELQKIRANLVEEQENTWYVEPAPPIKSLSPIRISTYDDHRMAMAFAPLATMADVMIEEPDVVQKSYPDFWIEMQKAGFKTEIRTV